MKKLHLFATLVFAASIASRSGPAHAQIPTCDEDPDCDICTASTECRNQLFFVKDIVAADDVCAQAVADDPTDGEARFFRAATRILRVVGENVDGADATRFTDSVKEMMDQFGISDSGRDVYDFSPKLPKNLAGDVDLPSDSPNGSDVQEAQSGLLVPAITASVDDLRAISAGTTIPLNTCELDVFGNFSAVEIDLGDVELIKAILLLGSRKSFWSRRSTPTSTSIPTRRSRRRSGSSAT